MQKIVLPDGKSCNASDLIYMQNSMEPIKGCLNIAILKLCYDIVLPAKATIVLSILGVEAGTIKLDLADPCQTITINAGVASGEITLCFKDKCLLLSGAICALGQCISFDDVKVICL